MLEVRKAEGCLSLTSESFLSTAASCRLFPQRRIAPFCLVDPPEATVVAGFESVKRCKLSIHVRGEGDISIGSLHILSTTCRWYIIDLADESQQWSPVVHWSSLKFGMTDSTHPRRSCLARLSCCRQVRWHLFLHAQGALDPCSYSKQFISGCERRR